MCECVSYIAWFIHNNHPFETNGVQFERLQLDQNSLSVGPILKCYCIVLLSHFLAQLIFQ